MPIARKQLPPAAGYSGKPLWQKLGLKQGLRVRLANAPDDYFSLCGFDAAQVAVTARKTGSSDFTHAFATQRAQLQRDLPGLIAGLADKGALWISWPKKTARVATDISEDTLREIVLPLGLVDIKVCAVSEVWSALKFVRRRADDKTP
ncbi:DUF3052 domain-containing protein [Rudaea sp.]|uniref:DUF3052 domain-containing protein n=1 Tax=Rudaea sp. TaxID=2136325 RepID=UPI002ED12594